MVNCSILDLWDADQDAILPEDANDDVEYPCLLRATDGHVKFETKVGVCCIVGGCDIDDTLGPCK